MYSYFEFEVTLQGVEPPIMRRFLLRREASFYEMHQAIQLAGGWQDYHLFVFRREPDGEAIAGIPELDAFEASRDPDAKRVKLAPYFEAHDTCCYEYDFGDSWLHDVKRVGTIELPYKFKRALLAGTRAFPPEDSGGVGGYERLVAILETGVDPWEDDPEEIREWMGDWNPDAFDLKVLKSRFDK